MLKKKTHYLKLLVGLLLGGALMVAVGCGGEAETVVETVVVEKTLPGEKVVETVIVEKTLPGETVVEKVVETVVVEKIIAGEKVTVVETVVVEKAVPGEKVVETVVVVATPTAAAPTRPQKVPSGSVTIAVLEISPLIQEPRRDIASVGGIGKDFSIYETIVRAPAHSPPNPPPMQDYSPDDLGVAEWWTVDSDLTGITFKIRDDIPWHTHFGDWGYVDAEDVAWSFNSAFAPDSVNNGAEEIGPEMKLGFDVLGPMTVKQNIEPAGFDPTWAWLQGNAGYCGIVIVNKDAFDALGPEAFSKAPIGTGRYMALEWKSAEHVILEAVTEHWTGIIPNVKTVTIVSMPEQATRDAALRAGEIDIAELTPEVLRSTVDAIGGRVQDIGIPRPKGFQLAGNYWGQDCPACEGGIMARPGYDEALANGYPWVGELGNAVSMENARKVRWAMAMTVDQESLIEYVLEGFGRVIYAWQNILPDSPQHKDEWIIPYDPTAAKQLMVDAGYPNGFDYEIWVPGTETPANIASAESVAQAWRQELGLNATIDKTAYATRRPQTVDKTINVPFMHGINWLPGSTSARYICAFPGHIVGFTMEDDICAIGLSNATEPSLNKRVANNIAVQDYLSHQMLFIPIYQIPAVLFAVGPRIDKWEPYNSTDVFPNRPESITLK